MSYFGKLRVLLWREEDPISCYQKGFEVVDYKCFDDRLITGVEGNQIGEVLEEEVRCAGISLFEDSIWETVKAYKPGDVIEVLGDAFIEWSKSHGDWGTEYDAEGWLENIKHRKLTEEQIKRFVDTEEDPLWKFNDDEKEPT